MTLTRDRIYVEHIGGPYDSQYQYVEVDENGQPPEQYTLNDFGRHNPLIDPMRGIQYTTTVRFYELDTVIREDGPAHVYRYRGEHDRDYNDGAPEFDTDPGLTGYLRRLGYDIPDPDTGHGQQAA